MREHPLSLAKPLVWGQGKILIVTALFKLKRELIRIASVRGLRLSGFPGWFVWFFIHLAFLSGFGNRLFTMLRWMRSMIGRGRAERQFSTAHVGGDLSPFQPMFPRVVLETKAEFFVYEVSESDIVLPTDVGVLEPVPNQPGKKPNQAVMTMTSCHPKYSATERFIVHGTLVKTVPRAQWEPATWLAPPKKG